MYKGKELVMFRRGRRQGNPRCARGGPRGRCVVCRMSWCLYSLEGEREWREKDVYSDELLD